jgi:flagellar protein FliS
MYNSSRAASAYQAVSLESRVASSSSHELVTLLFEGFLERVQLASRAIEQKDITAKIRYIDKAIQILSEGLRTHLDLKSGGELAQNLDNLYGYCIVHLVEANLHNDTKILAHVLRLIEPVALAWKQNKPTQATANQSHSQSVLKAVEGGFSEFRRARSPGAGAYSNLVFVGV